MKRIIQKTAELATLIEKKIKDREKLYDSRKINMETIEVRSAYNHTTDLLSDSLNRLNDLICELTENN
jgi:hypothetical protein